MRPNTSVTVGVAAIILAGCGGGSGDGNRIIETRDVNALLEDGETLVAVHVAGEGPGDIRVRHGADGNTGELHENGEWSTFVDWSGQGPAVWLDDLSVQVSDDDAFDYFTVLSVRRDGQFYDAMFGNVTDIGGIRRPGTATYSDNSIAKITMWNDDGPETVINEHDGRMRLTADFDTSTIGGWINVSSDTSAMTLTMLETSFGRGGFSGDFSTTGMAEGDSANLSYEGSFFGPTAEEVAGTISGRAVVDGTSFDAIGWFGATDDLRDY